MRRAAQLLAWLLMALTKPAYYTACVLLVLRVIGVVYVDWPVILGFALYAPAAIVVDVVVKHLTATPTTTEPGGSPGTEG